MNDVYVSPYKITDRGNGPKDIFIVSNIDDHMKQLSRDLYESCKKELSDEWDKYDENIPFSYETCRKNCEKILERYFNLV